MQTAMLSLGMVPVAGTARPQGDGGPGATEVAAAGGLFAGMLAAAPGKPDPSPTAPGAAAPAAMMPGLGRSPLDLLAIAPEAPLGGGEATPATEALAGAQLPAAAVPTVPQDDAAATAPIAGAAPMPMAVSASAIATGMAEAPAATTALPATATTAVPATATTAAQEPGPLPAKTDNVPEPPTTAPNATSGEPSRPATPATAPEAMPTAPAPGGTVAPEAAAAPRPDLPVSAPSATAAEAVPVTDDSAGTSPAPAEDSGSESGTDPESPDEPSSRAEAAPAQPFALPTLTVARPSLQVSSPLMPTNGSAAGTPDAQAEGSAAPAATARPGAFAGLAAEAVARLGSTTAAGSSLGTRPADRAANVHTQVLQQVSGSLVSGRDEQKLTIQLHPESLGQVDAELNASQDRLSLVLRASTPEAANALRANMRELTENIIERATRFQHVDIRVELRDGAEPRPERPHERRHAIRSEAGRPPGGASRQPRRHSGPAVRRS